MSASQKNLKKVICNKYIEKKHKKRKFIHNNPKLRYSKGITEPTTKIEMKIGLNRYDEKISFFKKAVSTQTIAAIYDRTITIKLV